MIAPRVGAGLSAGLGVLDWARRNNKANEEREAFAAFPKFFSSGGGAPSTQALAAGGEGGTNQTPATPTTAPRQGMDLDAAMNDPAIQKNPEAMAFIARIKATQAMREPRQQLVPNGLGGMSVVTMPAEGAPSSVTVPGVSVPQKFGQGLEDMLYSTFGKPGPGGYTPEQTQQAQGLLLKQVEDKETRLLDRQSKLQAQANENYFTRMEKSQKFTQDQANLNAGRGEFRVLNGQLYRDLTTVNKEAAKAKAGLYVNGQPMRKATIDDDLQRIEQEKQDAIKGVHEGYLTQWENLQTQYPFLQGMTGGTPGYVRQQMEKNQSMGNLPDDAIYKQLQAINPAYAASFQKALKTDPAGARRIGLGLLRKK